MSKCACRELYGSDGAKVRILAQKRENEGGATRENV